jgi:hypothetical protein
MSLFDKDIDQALYWILGPDAERGVDSDRDRDTAPPHDRDPDSDTAPDHDRDPDRDTAMGTDIGTDWDHDPLHSTVIGALILLLSGSRHGSRRRPRNRF